MVSRVTVWSLSIIFTSIIIACGETPVDQVDLGESRTFVGRSKCASCHSEIAELWEGSDHDLSMQVANKTTVLGNFDGEIFEYAGISSVFEKREGRFFVHTEGPEGALAEYEILYTFGVNPLQQYLIQLEDGRYQALSIAWDTRSVEKGGGRWFHLYPDQKIDYKDPLHWTKPFQNWNRMCAFCHSTGLRKHYDLKEDHYETQWAEIDVSCEACHGPGSSHVLWAANGARGDPLLRTLSNDSAKWIMNVENGISARQPERTEHLEIETCASCHSHRSQLTERDDDSQLFLDSYNLSLLREPLYYSDGQIKGEVYVYGSFLQSKMYQKGVTCQDCHNPHSLTVPGETNAVCGSCHLAERFDSVGHTFHEPGTRGSACVDCHMPETTYMVVDRRRDHSLRIPRPDLTVLTGTPNACNGCHVDESADWAAKQIEEWFGHTPELHYGEVLDSGWNETFGVRKQFLDLFNDSEVPDIVKASIARLAPIEEALRSDDALIRLGGIEGTKSLDPTLKYQLLVPLLGDDVRSVRIEAVRILASVPTEMFNLEQRKRLQEGLREYVSVQELNADWPESHLSLARLYTHQNKFKAAEAEYRIAVKLEPTFDEAYVNLADLYRSLGDEESSEAILREGLLIVKDKAVIHYALGLTLVRLGRRQEAIAELRLASELGVSEAQYAYTYGIALKDFGDIEGAIQVLKVAHERNQKNVDILFSLVTCMRDSGQYVYALEYAYKLATLLPGNTQIETIIKELDAAKIIVSINEVKG